MTQHNTGSGDAARNFIEEIIEEASKPDPNFTGWWLTGNFPTEEDTEWKYVQNGQDTEHKTVTPEIEPPEHDPTV